MGLMRLDSRIATRKRAELLAAASETLDFELLRHLTAGFGPDTVAALAKFSP